MNIKQHKVTKLTPDSAMVGCTEVTKKEVEGLLEAMQKAKDFTVEDSRKIWSYVVPDNITFTMRSSQAGFVAISEDVEANPDFFAATSATVSLNRKKAQILFNFLATLLAEGAK